MIFDHRPLSEISDDEIDAVVRNHEKERQHLEFKATIEHKNKDAKKDAKLETLRDIASLANGGGGYLIVGVSDDGSGHAGDYSGLTREDAENIRKFLISICQDHIRERIQYLEAEAKDIKGNAVLIVRIPQSDLIPHMVKFDNKTDFWTRHDDGKKQMTYGEIRRAFRKDKLDRQLTRIEHQLRQFIGFREAHATDRHTEAGRKRNDSVTEPHVKDRDDAAGMEGQVTPMPVAETTGRNEEEAIKPSDFETDTHIQGGGREARIGHQVTDATLANAEERNFKEGLRRIAAGVQPYIPDLEDSSSVIRLSDESFRRTIGDQRYYRLAVTPANPGSNSVDVGAPEIRTLINEPPEIRYGGWDMGLLDRSGYRIQRFSLGIYSGEKVGGGYLELWTNGHMEFWCPIDDLFCWGQSNEEAAKNPILHPCAVSEFPVSFLKLYRRVVDASQIADLFQIQMLYVNIRGVRLRKGKPGTFGYELDSNPRSFKDSEFNHSVTAEPDFAPDEVAYELINPFYAEFGHGERSIPFYDKDKKRFDFPS